MKQAAEIISILFISREQAHREHLRTTSYAKHMALAAFYEGIVDIADEFAESFMGLYEPFSGIPYKMAKAGAIDDVLEGYMDSINELRESLDGQQDRPLQNIIDNACALYASTLYKLRNLK